MTKSRDIVSLENPEAVNVAPGVKDDQVADLDRVLKAQQPPKGEISATH